jgi:hypothetical protein
VPTTVRQPKDEVLPSSFEALSSSTRLVVSIMPWVDRPLNRQNVIEKTWAHKREQDAVGTR